MATPGAGGSRFPGFDVTDQAGAWDPVTTPVVLGRLTPAPAVFFTSEEVETVQALVDRLLAQNEEPRVPVVELIDTRLVRRAGDGYRYEDMPEDPEAWRASIAGLEVDAVIRHGRRFADLERGRQLRLVEDVRTTAGRWHELPAKRVFSLWMRYACTAFYSHPWAWNEIGFGGPAYPRGYKNLGLDRREHWEVAEGDTGAPVPWATRAEASRRRHTDALAPGGAP
jgi:hypothetical protein